MRRLQEKDSTLVQVLSLYLLLLAFFIVLFNASRFDASRSAAVGESLTSTFKPTKGTAGEARQNTSQEGMLVGDEAVIEHVGDLVRTLLGVTRVRVVRAGRLMVATVPASRFFVGGGAGLRPDLDGFLNQFAGILGKAPVGRRHEVDIRVGSKMITPDQMQNGSPLPIARASVLARTLLSRGALPGTVRSGVSFAHPEDVELIFRIDPEIRPEDREPDRRPGKSR